MVVEGGQEPVPTYSHVGYDYLGRKAWETDTTIYSGEVGDEIPESEKKYFEYDEAGRVTAVILPQVYEMASPAHNGTMLTNARPRYEYFYDEFGNLIEIRDNIYEPETGGKVVTYARSTIFTYDWLNNQTSRELPDGAKEYKQYDELGRVKVHIDFKEQATGYFYNNRGQLQYKCYYDFDGAADGVNENYDENDPNADYTARVVYTYDNLGRKKTVADERGTTTYHYNIEGRIEQIDTPKGTINYEYNLITGSRIRTYSNNTDTDYFYDILGRLETVQTTSEEVTYNYDAAGNRIWMGYDLDGSAGFEIETNYAYNSINRLTELVHQDTTGQLASYSYNLAADGQRVFLDEEIKLIGSSTETHEITYGYDNINRLTDETAESGDYGYDVYYEYDVVGNRMLREITVNSQPFTTEYEYYDGTDKLKTETQCGASCMLDIGDKRYYAYAKQNGKGFYYRNSNGNKIGSFHAFMLGLPSVWSRYLFIFAMAMVPVLLFGTAVKRIILRLLFCYGEPTRLRLRVPRKSICVLLAFLIFVGPDGFESLAQAEVQYANLGTSSWGEVNRTIEYTYDDNGALLTKTTEVTSTSEVIETVTNHYNLANRLDKVTTELANGDQHIVEYTYNDEGIRVRAYSYDIPYGQGVQNEKTVVYLVDFYNHTGYAQTLEEMTFDYADPDPLTDTPDSLTTYLIADDVLAQNVDGTTQYLLYDGHGSTRQLAEYDTSVSIAETFSYDGYGVLLQDDTIASQRPGYVSQQATSLLYVGEYFDSDSQNYYNRARWYSPLTGLFNRVDPFDGNLNDPQSLHKYLYCHANPVNNIDPSGNFATLAGLMTAVTVQFVTYSIIGVVLGDAMTGGKISAGISSFFSAIISPSLWASAALGVVSSFAGLITNAKALLKMVAVAILSCIFWVANIAMTLWNGLKTAGMIGDIVDSGLSPDEIGTVVAFLVATVIIVAIVSFAIGAAIKAAGKGLGGIRSNKIRGDQARSYVAAREGTRGIEKTVVCNGKVRRIDVVTDGPLKLGIETKVGRTYLTKDVRRQLARDVKIMRSKDFDIETIQWEFFESSVTGQGGPSGPLLEKLGKLGINVKIHNNISF